ncbi:MAG: cupin domain-containing protein [Gemmatimonadota bacterium]
MDGVLNAQPHPYPPIPADDPRRALTVLRPADDPGLRHVAVAGGVYTILLTGADTAGRFCLVEMRVPPGGGPPPHRHDFEETFRVLEGEVEFSFRGRQVVARAGETVNVPANAPHSFRNASGAPAPLLCTCSPPGQEELFLAVGVPMDSATAPAPRLSDAEKAERRALAEALAPRYRTEFLPAV